MTEKPGRKGIRMNRRQFVAAGAAVGVGGVITNAIGANERLGIGLIGCGGRGNSHLRVWKALKDAGENLDIVAVCDVYRPRMDRVAKAYNAKAYMDHRDLLADRNVDIVSIATPDHHHGYQVIDAVGSGKDVYCEKPVTHWRQFELTKKMAQAVKDSGRVFLLGTQGLSDGAWHRMKELVAGGLIGRPLLAECGYFRVGDWGERGMKIDDPNARPGRDLNWQAFLGDSPERPFDVSRFFRWRMYADYAGGPVTDLYPHSLTPVTSILDVSMPNMVVATGGRFRYKEREIPDTFSVLINYPEEFTITVLGTQGNNYVANGTRGAGGRIPVIRGWEGTLTIERKTNRIEFIPVQGSRKKRQYFDIPYGESMQKYFKHLLDCCRNRKTDTWSDAELAYRTQTALIMGMWAYREGGVARFDKEKQEIIL